MAHSRLDTCECGHRREQHSAAGCKCGCAQFLRATFRYSQTSQGRPRRVPVRWPKGDQQ